MRAFLDGCFATIGTMFGCVGGCLVALIALAVFVQLMATDWGRNPGPQEKPAPRTQPAPTTTMPPGERAGGSGSGK